MSETHTLSNTNLADGVKLVCYHVHVVLVGDCYVTLYDRADGKPMGAGLVEFRDISKAQEAVDKMNRYEVGGRKIIVREVSSYYFILFL